MRLFVAVWPPAEVVDALRRVPRREVAGVRWTAPQQWHVTLRFLGEVADDAVPGLRAALAAVGAGVVPRPAVLGPTTARLGRGPLVAPVAGLDDLAAEVVAATWGFGVAPDARPFRGHLTLARGRGRRPVPVTLAGAEVGASWEVGSFDLVHSRLSSDGARYDTVTTVALEGR